MPRRKITDDMYFHKKTKTWEMRETINGKRRSFSSKIPEEVIKKHNAAIAAAEEKKLDLTAGPLFSEVAAEYEEQVRKMKFGTQKAYLPNIRRAVAQFGNKRMREIEPYMISEFLKSLCTSAHTTVSNQKTVINAIFRAWISSPEWHGDYNPAELVKMPHGLHRGKREPPTDEQVQIVKNHYMDSDALPAVVFLCTGERRAEACGIQMQDIDFKSGTIRISKQAEYRGNVAHIVDYTKTKAGVRIIPLLNMLRQALEPLRFLSKSTYILSGTDKPLTASQYKHCWTAFWAKYGYTHTTDHCYSYTNRHGQRAKYHHVEVVADVCAHQFRHEYVCMLAEANIPEAVAIQLVGHANAKMIHEVYMSLKPQMVQDAAVRLDNLMATK